MTSLDHPQLSGLGRNPSAPQDVLVRLAAHKAGRHGISQRRGRLEDAVVDALLKHGDCDTAVGLHGDRISPEMRRRIAGHPDPAIRNAFTDFVRAMVDRKVRIGIDDLEEAYGRPRTTLAGAPSPRLRAAVARAWHDRPLAVQVELLADPDPHVRAAATERGYPGVPPEWRERCLADPAVRINVARHVPFWRPDAAKSATQCRRRTARSRRRTTRSAIRGADRAGRIRSGRFRVWCGVLRGPARRRG